MRSGKNTLLRKITIFALQIKPIQTIMTSKPIKEKIMKKIILLLLMTLTLPLSSQAQSYSDLWKQVKEAGGKDQPRTQIKRLESITAKARKEKSYGNLLAAELKITSLWANISSDSIPGRYAQLKQQATEAEKENKVLAAVYYCTLTKVAQQYNSCSEEAEPDTTDYVAKSLADPELLAQHQYTIFQPLITQGTDDRIFNNDLLHVIAMESDQYDLLDKFYSAKGNREAACYAALQNAIHRYSSRQEKEKDKYAATLDSLLSRYADMPISGEIALAQYRMLNSGKATAKEKINFIDKALERWSDWEAIKSLENERKKLTAPMFSVNDKPVVMLTGKTATLKDIQTRNINDLKLTITRTSLPGNTD